MVRTQSQTRPQHHGNTGEVFTSFLRLGLTSFGGPIAHLSYFREEFVNKQKWLSDSQYAQLLTICQFLPGPASSQLGFSIGLIRSGWKGGVAAFCGFTAPSALLLILFASFLPFLSGQMGQSALGGLKILTFAVVAHGVLGMYRSLCPDTERIIIATVAAVVILIGSSAVLQLVVVAAGAIAGVLWCRHVPSPSDSGLIVGHKSSAGYLLLVLFLLLLITLPFAAASTGGYFIIMDTFYRAGALVFGGGHVLLPLLEETVVTPGWVDQDTFLAGYGASQAIPGPLFAFSAYLGFFYSGGLGGLPGASLALLFMFLPGFLLVAGVLPFWQSFSRINTVTHAIAGINAAVVGILGAALYDPIFINGIKGPYDLSIGLIAFILLTVSRLSVIAIVIWCVAASICVGFI